MSFKVFLHVFICTLSVAVCSGRVLYAGLVLGVNSTLAQAVVPAFLPYCLQTHWHGWGYQLFVCVCVCGNACVWTTQKQSSVRSIEFLSFCCLFAYLLVWFAESSNRNVLNAYLPVIVEFWFFFYQIIDKHIVVQVNAMPSALKMNRLYSGSYLTSLLMISLIMNP